LTKLFQNAYNDKTKLQQALDRLDVIIVGLARILRSAIKIIDGRGLG
jgi:hypothetical protein